MLVKGKRQLIYGNRTALFSDQQFVFLKTNAAIFDQKIIVAMFVFILTRYNLIQRTICLTIGQNRISDKDNMAINADLDASKEAHNDVKFHANKKFRIALIGFRPGLDESMKMKELIRQNRFFQLFILKLKFSIY